MVILILGIVMGAEGVTQPSRAVEAEVELVQQAMAATVVVEMAELVVVAAVVQVVMLPGENSLAEHQQRQHLLQMELLWVAVEVDVNFGILHQDQEQEDKSI